MMGVRLLVLVRCGLKDATLRGLGQLDVLLLQHEAPELLKKDLDGVVAIPTTQDLNNSSVDLERKRNFYKSCRGRGSSVGKEILN